MLLSKLLEGVTVSKIFQTLYGQMVITQDIQINRVQYDSRKVAKGDLFVAIRGSESDGHDYVSRAVENGARVVVVENDAAVPDSFFMHAGVVKIVVPDSRAALARLSARYFNEPAGKLNMIGITGTNGKTTTSHLIKSILESSGSKTGLVGTIEYRIGQEVIPATHTTPESLELNELLARMVEAGCSSAVMEVSSHALHQHRVEGLDFKVAVFTNLTQDHLDYHGTMEEYFNAKKILFEKLGKDSWAVVNADDTWGRRIIKSTASKTVTYGINPGADFQARDLSLSVRGARFTVSGRGEDTQIVTSMIGRFNVSNILAAFATGACLGIPEVRMREAIKNTDSVRGRFEKIASPRGWTAVIDYAHTPDALEKALKAIRDVFGSGERGGRIITLFGCGGNRDRTKRPVMGRIASELSDVVIVTSDNPRRENAELIIDEITAGIPVGSQFHREADRKLAVHMALESAGPGDVILIAGKGHEDYQVIGDRKVHFSDKDTVEEFIRLHA